MRKFITNYKELRSEGIADLLDGISDRVNEKKGQILKYLKNGKEVALRCASIYDYVKDEPLLGETIKLFTDGEWYWCIFQPNSITVPKGLHAIPLQTA